MIKHAWDGYYKYALGENEVKPLSKKGHSAAVFGRTHLGATLVDSLDTLYIAGLHDEFNDATKWVKDHFHIAEVSMCNCRNYSQFTHSLKTLIPY